ncbi:FAD/NAD(P)-binding protein [Streptomyces virginiae]|uniref:FAD/NAD(P)-binding protein n=1 Tax=Streptomyces virginiae TaxID=1961 RepID=UPI0032496E0D
MTRPAEVVIVGGGPRATGVLERILANVPGMLPARDLHVHVVDPYPPGAGRVWRAGQSPLMWVNVPARDITMFTDETVRCDGPFRPGPSLDEWAGTSRERGADEEGIYAGRLLQGDYLTWVFGRIVAERPTNVRVSVHATRATGLTGGPDGRQLVRLADGEQCLPADIVILALGHLDGGQDRQASELGAFADRHALAYVPRAYSADVDLSVLRPREKVIVRGFGLAFVDLAVLLTEGRGGAYRVGGDGRLHYLASGEEPQLYVGSRRGVPYRTKISYRPSGAPAALPRFFDGAAFQHRPPQEMDFRTELWPLMAKEIGWAHYHELFTAHRDRVAVDWADFSTRYAASDWNSRRLAEHIEACVPDPVDRLDLGRLDRPLRGVWYERFADLQAHVRGHISADVARRGQGAHSADLGTVWGLKAVSGQLATLLGAGRLSARSEANDVAGWWKGFYDYVCSGPPSPRARQLVALSEAGVLNFLGSGMWLVPDESRGVFRAGSANTAHTVDATSFVEARLPQSDLRRCPDTLLRGLLDRAEAVEHVVTDQDGFTHRSGLLHVSPDDFRVVDASGRPHPRRYALGPFTSIRHFATFGRPRANGLSFRQNDALARHALRTLGGD